MTFKTTIILGMSLQVLSLILNAVVGIKLTSCLVFGMAGFLFGVLITEFFIIFIMKTFFNKKWLELMERQ